MGFVAQQNKQPIRQNWPAKIHPKISTCLCQNNLLTNCPFNTHPHFYLFLLSLLVTVFFLPCLLLFLPFIFLSLSSQFPLTTFLFSPFLIVLNLPKWPVKLEESHCMSDIHGATSGKSTASTGRITLRTTNIVLPLTKQFANNYRIAFLGKIITQLLAKQPANQTDLPCMLEISTCLLSKLTCLLALLPSFSLCLPLPLFFLLLFPSLTHFS